MFYHERRVSGLNSHVRSDTLWHSSKAADSGCHDKVVDIMIAWLSRKTHLKYKAKTAEKEINELREGRMAGSTKLLCTSGSSIRSQNEEGR